MEGREVRKERRRRRLAFWKRRRFWIVLLAVAVGSALTIWLIRIMETPVRPPE